VQRDSLLSRAGKGADRNMAKKVKKKNKEHEAIRYVVEANQLCIAEAIVCGVNYYKWDTEVINDMVSKYYRYICAIDEMPDRKFHKWEIASAQAQKYVPQTRLIDACRMLHPKRQEIYMLCLGCMVLALSDYHWDSYHINIFVKCVLYQLKENNVHPFIDRVGKEIGYNVRTSIAWYR
jgi:hypothetical protein